MFRITISRQIIPIILFSFFYLSASIIGLILTGSVYVVALSYVVFGVYTVYWLKIRCQMPGKVNAVFYYYVFSLFLQLIKFQGSVTWKALSYGLELVFLSIMLILGLVGRKKMSTTIILIAGLFIFCDLTACLFTYNNLYIGILSVYDTCRFFAITLYVMSLKMKLEYVKNFFDVLSLFTTLVFLISLLQFMGYTNLFTPFLRNYNIVSRYGNFRAVGVFNHGIELGDFSTLMFAIFYSLSKYTKSKWYTVCSLMMVFSVILSGTRVAFVAVALVFLMNNIKKFTSWLKMIVAVGILVVVVSSFINVELLLQRTKIDLNTETARLYYFEKGIKVWEDHPLFGIGYATYCSNRYRKMTNDCIFDEYDIHKYDFAHLKTSDSFIAEIIPEYGVIGMGLIAYMMMYARKNLNNKIKIQEEYRIIKIIFLCFIMIMLNSASAFFSYHVGSVFWIGLGLIFAEMDNATNTPKLGKESQANDRSYSK